MICIQQRIVLDAPILTSTVTPTFFSCPDVVTLAVAQMLPEALRRATMHRCLRAVLVHYMLWLCSGAQRSIYITQPSISVLHATALSSTKSDWPQTWSEKGNCRLCDCDYPTRSVNCNARDFSDGLPAAEDFPWEDLVVL